MYVVTESILEKNYHIVPTISYVSILGLYYIVGKEKYKIYANPAEESWPAVTFCALLEEIKTDYMPVIVHSSKIVR